MTRKEKKTIDLRTTKTRENRKKEETCGKERRRVKLK